MNDWGIWMRGSLIKKNVCSVWLGYKYYTVDGDTKPGTIGAIYIFGDDRAPSEVSTVCPLSAGMVRMILMTIFYVMYAASNVTVHRHRIFESQMLLTPTICGSNRKHAGNVISHARFSSNYWLKRWFWCVEEITQRGWRAVTILFAGQCE